MKTSRKRVMVPPPLEILASLCAGNVTTVCPRRSGPLESYPHRRYSRLPPRLHRPPAFPLSRFLA